MKKILVIIISLFLIPVIVNAETLTYDVCKNGCEYNNIKTVLLELEELTNNDELDNDDIIINFKTNDIYTNEDKSKKFILGYKNDNTNVNSFTINGNNSTLEYYNIGIAAQNVVIKDLNLVPYYNTKDIYGQYSDLISYTYSLEQNGSSLGIAAGNGKIENVKATLIEILNIPRTVNIEINNSNFNVLGNEAHSNLSINTSDIGVSVINNSVCNISNSIIYMIGIFYTDRDTIINISNSKIQRMSSTFNINKGIKQEINMYNPLFDKIFKYIKFDYGSEHAEFDYDNTVPIVDEYFYDENRDITNTTIYFDKETEIKLNDKINLADYLDYYTEDKEISYTIEDESIAKIENKELIGLNPGNTKVQVTTDDGHVIYNIDLTVYTISEKKVTMKAQNKLKLNTVFKDLDISSLSDDVWEISNPSVAKVVNGEIISLQKGETDIVAIINGVKYVYHLTVSDTLVSKDVKVPITGKSIKLWIVIVTALLLSVIGVCSYILIRKRK